MPRPIKRTPVRPTRYGDQKQILKKRKSTSPRAKSTTPVLIEEINQRFKKIRYRMNLTQAELAERLSSPPHITVSVSTIKAIENNVVSPNIYILRRLKEISGVSYDYLLDGKGRIK